MPDKEKFCFQCGSFFSKDGALANWLLECFTDCTRLENLLEHTGFFNENARTLILEQRGRLLDFMNDLKDAQNGNSSVKVGVVGKFSSGKSMFINSLLGAKICPSSEQPTTSGITRFRYGESGEPVFSEMTAAWEKRRSLTRTMYEELAQHGDNRADGYYFECCHSTADLRDIIVYDTPGFNNADCKRGARDEELTRKALEDMDVVVFMTDIEGGSLGADMVSELHRLKDAGRTLYLVVNKADLKPPQPEKPFSTNASRSFRTLKRPCAILRMKSSTGVFPCLWAKTAPFSLKNAKTVRLPWFCRPRRWRQRKANLQKSRLKRNAKPV